MQRVSNVRFMFPQAFVPLFPNSCLFPETKKKRKKKTGNIVKIVKLNIDEKRKFHV